MCFSIVEPVARMRMGANALADCAVSRVAKKILVQIFDIDDIVLNVV